MASQDNDLAFASLRFASTLHFLRPSATRLLENFIPADTCCVLVLFPLIQVKIPLPLTYHCYTLGLQGAIAYLLLLFISFVKGRSD